MTSSNNNNLNFGEQKSYYIENEEFNFNKLYQGILRRKKFVLSSTIFFFLLSLIFTSFQRIFNPVFQGSFTMLTDDPMLDNSSGNPSNRSDANLIALQYTQYEDIALSKSTYDNDTLIELLKSPIYLNQVEKDLDLPKSSISKIISIKPPKTNLVGSNNKVINGVLNIEIKSKNILKGELILKKLVDIYLKSSLERRQQRLNDGLKFLDKQAPKIENKKKKLQESIVSFREKNKLLFPSEEGKNIKVQQNLIDKEILNLNLERDRLTNIRQEIIDGKLTGMGFKEKLGEGFLIRVTDQETLAELIALEIDLTKAKTKFTNNSSVVKNLNSRLNLVQSELRIKQIEAIDTALKLNSGDLKSAKIQKIDIEKRFIKQPELIKEYKNLEQELNFINQNLLGLEKARESFQLEIAQNTIPWRIISPPEMETKAHKPKFLLNIFTGTFVGLLIGLIIALIRDKIDNVFHNSNEIKEDIEAQLLATVPFINQVKLITDNFGEIESNRGMNFIALEAFRYIFTIIKSFKENNNNKKVFAVTSSIPSEGKTLISILLAKVIALMDIKVLLIDADMRKPNLHNDLNLKNDFGLSDILLGNIDLWEKGVQVYQDNKFLEIITAGSIYKDPPRLLSDNNFGNFIERIKKKNNYDYIIINNTPLLGLTDAILVAENSDSVLLAVSINKVDRNLVKESIFRLSRNSKVNFLGVIANYLERYEYEYYGYSKDLNYSDTYLKYSSENEEFSDETNKNENKISIFIRKNKYIKTFYKNIYKFIRWLNK